MATPEVVRGSRRQHQSRGALVASVLLVVIVASWTSWLLVAKAGPWDETRISGARFPDSNFGDGVSLQTMVDPAGSPLRQGDRVIAVDGQPVEEWMASARGEDFRVGDRLTYRVVRDGRELDVVITLGRYDWAAALRHSAVTVILAAALFAISFAVIAVRRTEPAARVMFAIAVLVPFGFAHWPLKGQLLDLSLSPWPMWPELVGSCVWALVLGAMVPHFALVFPRPPPLTHPGRVVAALYAAPFVAHGLYLAVTLPAADGRLERLERVSTAWETTQLYAPVLVIGLLAWSLRRTSGTPDHDRTKLVAASLVVAFAVNIAVVQIPQLSEGDMLVPSRYWVALFLLCPLAVAVSVAHTHLFDINLVLRRSLLAIAVGAVLALAYAACLLFVGSPNRDQLPFFVVGSLAALALPPAYRALRRMLDRRLYGSRGHPLEVLERIVALDSATAPESVLRHLADLLAETLRLPYVAVTLDVPGGPYSAQHGAEDQSAQRSSERIVLERDGRPIGHLDLAVAPDREPFGPADRQLLTSIAAHTEATMRTTLLNADLRKAHTKLLTVRAEERRRIRRELHDGVGPSLALLAMHLEVAQEMVRRDGPRATERVVDEAQTCVRDAISEVRRSVQSLRPTLLDEVGLEGAIRILAKRTNDAHRPGARPAAHPPLRVEVEIDPRLGATSLPAAVETAAYRIVSEALNNVSKHAAARRCTIRVDFEGGLRLSVADDGVGIPTDPAPGAGLGIIAERASELGGTATIRPDPRGGTLVTTTLPV